MSLKKIFDDSGNPYLVKEHNGENYPYAVPGNVGDHLNGIKKLVCRDDDVIVMGYLRCGNHWTREMASMLMRGEATYMKSNNINDAPIEVMEIDYMNKLKSPRVVWTHLGFDRLPDDFIKRRCKILCAIRNPKDAFVSLYVILQKYKDMKVPEADVFKGTIENFMYLIFNNDFPYGNWFSFYEKLEKALANIPDYPLMMVTFEDLKKDTVGQLRKMAEFLEVPFTEQLLIDIKEKCSFHNLKKEKTENISEYAKSLSADGSEIYYRKGDIGDWKNHFTVASDERFNAFFANELQDPSFKYRDMYSSN